MSFEPNADGMRRMQAEMQAKLNAQWLEEVRAVQRSHGDKPKDEIKAELARRWRALFGGALSDAQLDGEADNIISHR